MKNKMSVVEYISRKGNLCPFCKSDDVEVVDEENLVGDGFFTCNVKCEDCEKIWSEEYSLTNYSTEVKEYEK